MLARVTAAADAGAAVSYCRCLRRWCGRRYGTGGSLPGPPLPSPSRSGGDAGPRREEFPYASADCAAVRWRAALQQPQWRMLGTVQAGHSPGLGTVQGWAGPRWGGMPVQPCMRGSPLTFDGVGGSVPAMRRARLAIWQHACRSTARLGWYSRARPSRATLPLGVKRQWILRYLSVEDRGRNDASGSHDELWILAASG